MSNDDLFYSFTHLLRAAKNAGRSHKKRLYVKRFNFYLEREIIDLSREISQGTYSPRPLKPFVIYEPKKRQIHSSHFRDRVVHHAICDQLEPRFESRFSPYSYACRKDKGHIKGVADLHGALRKLPVGKLIHLRILKADIKSYFANIRHSILLELIKRDTTDAIMYETIQKILAAHNGKLGVGLPIGNLTSQLFANLYLNELDHFIDPKVTPVYYRYMDDFVMIYDQRYHRDAELLAKISEFLRERLQLELNQSKIFCNNSARGIEFLGYFISPRRVSIKNSNFARLKRKLCIKQRLITNGEITPDSYKLSLISWRGILTHSHDSTQKTQLLFWAIKKFGAILGYPLWYFFLWTLKTPPLAIRRLQSFQKNAHIAYHLWLSYHGIDVPKSARSRDK